MTDLNDDQRAIVEECDAIKAMLLEKNKNYGSSALDPVRVFSKASSVEQILVRLDDKLSRLARGNEADEDVTLDILGYLVLLRIARRRRENASRLLTVHAYFSQNYAGTACGSEGTSSEVDSDVTCEACIDWLKRGKVIATHTVHLMKKMRCGCPSEMTFCGINALEKLIRGQGTLDPMAATCIECKRVHDQERQVAGCHR
jgi:hypothetical protein